MNATVINTPDANINMLKSIATNLTMLTETGSDNTAKALYSIA